MGFNADAKPWTAHEDAALLSMRKAGMNNRAAGAQIGRSENSCKGRYYTLTNACNINARRCRDLGQPIPAEREPRPINDAGHVATLRAAGGFRGLEFTPGRVFAYVNRRAYEVMVDD